MNGARRVALGAAFLTLISFLLPWVSASGDNVTGLELARSGNRLLWLVPALLLTIIILGTLRIVWERASMLFALSGTAGGGMMAYVIYLTRDVVTDRALIPVEWTVWYWASLVTSLVIAAAALLFYARRTRSK